MQLLQPARAVQVLLIFSAAITQAFGQASLSLPPMAADAGETVSLPLSLSGEQAQLSAMQWNVIYDPSVFTAVHVNAGTEMVKANKDVACHLAAAGRITCVAFGHNRRPIHDGVVANVSVAVSPGTTASASIVTIQNVIAAAPNGDRVAISGASARIPITPIAVRITSLSCSPEVLTLESVSDCSVRLSSPAPTGGVRVGLSAAVAGGAVLNIPPSVLVPAHSVVGSFQIRLSKASSSATGVVTASLSGISRSATIIIVPPVVRVSPPAITLSAGQSAQFAATVEGISQNSVSWSLEPRIGNLSSNGLYTAPGSIAAATTVVIRATSVRYANVYSTATVTLRPAIPSSSPGSGLLAWWPFNEGAGFVTADQSGNGHAGRLSRATWTAGYTGSAILFDGSQSPVRVGDFDISDNAFTVSAWFKFHGSAADDPRIISKASGSDEQSHHFMLSLTERGGRPRLRFRLKLAGATKTLLADEMSVPANQWVHAAATYDGSRIRLYQNGVEAAVAAASGRVTGSRSTPVAIGANPDGYGAFRGVIDEVRLYNRALSRSEINEEARDSETAVTVSVSPGTASVRAGQSQQFTATISGASNKSVIWSLSPSVGSITASGVYTAPANLNAQQTVIVRATSAADTNKFATATVTVTPAVAVSLSPATATIQAGKSQQFTAMVKGASGSAVKWSISPALGSISSTGLYSAPLVVNTPQTVTVRATSVADSARHASALVTIMPAVAVSVSPGAATVGPGGVRQFHATVSGTSNTAVLWTISPRIGSISGNGLYTAPANASPAIITITATSVADASKRATSTVTLIQSEPIDMTLSCSPSELIAPSVTRCTVLLSGPAPSSGLRLQLIRLAPGSVRLLSPASVAVAPHQRQSTFDVKLVSAGAGGGFVLIAEGNGVSGWTLVRVRR